MCVPIITPQPVWQALKKDEEAYNNIPVRLFVAKNVVCVTLK